MLKQTATIALTALLLTGCAALTGTATNPIPVLDTQGDVYKTEGPNDPLIYIPPVGDLSVIILYADFPDRPNDGDTRERARNVLGGDEETGTFQQIFQASSYGNLSLDISHVHGYRRMPRESRVYDPTTTEGHREMFVDAFALYPEVNLLEYDYVIVLMSGKGNFAFGERPDEAIPYRGEVLTVAVNQGSNSPYTLAHELAHCMGLPDVYTYTDRVPEDAPRNPFGPWDIMSGPSTSFMGWHRHKLGWMADDRKTYLSEGTHTLTLTPLDSEDGVSMIVIPAEGEDAASPSKVFVAEVGLPLRVREDRQPEPGGVLVYSVDATRPSGQNPVVAYPRQDIINATFHAGDTFEHDDAPMTVRVLSQNDDGSYEVEVVID